MDLVIPIALTRFQVNSEIRNVNIRRRASGDDRAYTYEEFQAKCHHTAEYRYDSWGGSYTQDFLQLVIGYTLIACFSQVQRWMAILGVFCLIIEYKILSFRMTNVTCRPWPLYGHGIGVWQDILNMASTCAITVNVYLVVFWTGVPGDNWKKLIIFVVAEKV